MRQFFPKVFFLFAIFYVFAALSARAISPDPQILSLIPAEARVLAGMRAFPQGADPERSFLLMTKDNKTDLDDFGALMGVDSSMHTNEVIFEGTPDMNGALCMHSLLASGSFNRDHIYKAAISNGATTIKYRGIDVLVIEPFQRERDTFHETRWLAIVDDRIALFGTITNVAHELNRYLGRSSPEPVFVKALDRLKKNAETWSMLLDVSSDPQIANALKTMEAILPEPAPMGSTLEFSIHYGSHIDFEYDVHGPSVAEGQSRSTLLQQRPFAGSAFLAPSTGGSGDGPSHGVVKLSKEKYVAWVTDIDARNRAAMQQ